MHQAKPYQTRLQNFPDETAHQAMGAFRAQSKQHFDLMPRTAANGVPLIETHRSSHTKNYKMYIHH